MKACLNCGYVDEDNAKTCGNCGGVDFDDLHMTPSWNNVEPYLEVDDDNLSD